MSTHPPIRTWTDAYLAMKARLESLRGFVEINPDTDEALRWPRTTGTDVIFIAAPIDHAFVRAPSIFGSERLRRRWRACLGELEPHETYADNRAFWTCLLDVSVHLDAAAMTPPDDAFWTAFFIELERHPGVGVRNAGPIEKGPFVTFDGIKAYDEMYIAQYKYLREHRGTDTMAPPTETVAGYSIGGGTFPVPRTTNGDVLQLAAYWSHAFADARAVVNNHNAVAGQWKAVLADVDRLEKGADPNAVYPKNNIFWRVMEDVSTDVAVSAETPTRWEMLVSAVEHSVKNLPENLAKEIEWLGGHAKDAVVDVAGAAGDAANKAIKGLFSGLTTPLLLGGGVLAAVLLLRSGDDDASHATAGG
jgi:hypothetical protein